MTNVSTHRFDCVASTALYSEASSQQRSYFSVLEQVAQASRLQQQLRLFLQDDDNPCLPTSSTSANFDIITQKIGNLFSRSFLRLLLTVTDPFLNFIMTFRTLLTDVWTIRLSCLAVSNLCNRFRHQARAFRVWTTQRFRQLRQHISRHFPRPASREHDDSATSLNVLSYALLTRNHNLKILSYALLTRKPNLKVLSYALSRAVLVSLQLSTRLLKRNR